MATFQAASFLADISASTVTSITWNHTVSAGTNLALLIGVGIEQTTLEVDNLPAPTFNGDSLTHDVGAAVSGGQFARSEIWGMVNPDVVTDGAIVVEFTGTGASHCGGGSVSATLVDQTGPFRTAATAGATSGTTASAEVGSVGSSDLCFDALALDSAAAASEGADQTERWEVQEAGAITVASSTQPGSAGGVMSWTFTDRPYALIATAFIHDGSGGAGRTTKNTRAWPLGVNVGMGWRMPA